MKLSSEMSSSLLLLSPTSNPSLNSTMWLLAEDLSGPAISAFVSLEFLLGLPLNLFIILHTLCYGNKYMNKSTMFLFFILALSDLLKTVLYLPFWIVASAAEEWIFGSTDNVRDILCQINGFVIIFLIIASTYALAVISVDRFLMIVKPQVHKKYMTWKTSLIIMIVLWAIDVSVSAVPYYGSDFGIYGLSPRIGSCFALFEGHRLYVLLQALHAIIPISMIAVTSIWTFVFTRGFLRRNLNRQKAMLNTSDFEEQKHVYSVQVLNLIGIFGSLLFLNFLYWIPFLLIGLVGFGIGYESIPDPVYAASFIIFHFSNVSNPIIQTLFRKDLSDSLKKIICVYKLGCKTLCAMNKTRKDMKTINEHVPMKSTNDNSVEIMDINGVRVMSASLENQSMDESPSDDQSIKTEETLDQDEISLEVNLGCSTDESNTAKDKVVIDANCELASSYISVAEV